MPETFCAQFGGSCGGLLFQIALELIVLPLSILIALWYDNLGKPRLRVSLAPAQEFKGGTIRHLYLNVINQPRSGPLIRRKTAAHCHGTISAFTQSGEPIFQHMPIRWAGNPEPLEYQMDQGQMHILPDRRLLRLSRYMNLPPDSVELIDTAMRVVGEECAFGFTETSYLHNRRHPEYCIPTGADAILRVELRSDDTKFPAREFILHNPSDLAGFRLTEKP